MPTSGRALARLLFVTNEARLAERTGDRNGVSELLADLEATAGVLLARCPKTTADGASEWTRTEVRRLREEGTPPDGIVLLGGYAVIPAERMDCLPKQVLGRVKREDDGEDGFYVWNDDSYGAIRNAATPELPVSRVPEAGEEPLGFMRNQLSGLFKARSLVARALAKGAAVGDRLLRRGTPQARAYGLFVPRRPFANEIFERHLRGRIETSMPVRLPDQLPDWPKRPLAVYILLHGSANDGDAFHGELGFGQVQAMNVAHLPKMPGATLLAGCCWGALIVDTLASRANAGTVLASRSPKASLALSALGRGASAFIGGTGKMYSPTYQGQTGLCQPLHNAFWAAYRSGFSPAVALLRAKREYVRAMSHLVAQKKTPTDRALALALNSKMVRASTCLGLGY